MSKSSWVRGDLTAPTTPEQYHAAIQRQERVIADLRKRLEVALRSVSAEVPEDLDNKVRAADRAEHPIAKETLISEAVEILDRLAAAPSRAEPDHIADANKKVEEESEENHG